MFRYCPSVKSRQAVNRIIEPPATSRLLGIERLLLARYISHDNIHEINTTLEKVKDTVARLYIATLDLL